MSVIRASAGAILRTRAGGMLRQLWPPLSEATASLLRDADGIYFVSVDSSDANRISLARDPDGVFYPAAAGVDGGFDLKRDADGVFYAAPTTTKG